MVRRHARSEDFQLVGFGSDPTPGDLDGIREVLTRYREIGDSAADALVLLRNTGRIAKGRGDAMEQIRDRIDRDLTSKLAKTRESYQEAAEAYEAYLPQLEEAQDTFDRAVDQARAGQQQVLEATGSGVRIATQTVLRAQGGVTDEEQAQTREESRAVREQADAGTDQLNAAKRLAQQAKSIRDRAASRCGDVLDRAADEAVRLPKRNFFQRIGDFFKDFPFVQILLTILIAIVAVFVPVVGALLAGLLFAFEQTIAIATGNFQLGDFLVGLVGIIPGAGVFSKLAGKAEFAAPLFSNLASVLNRIDTLQDGLGAFKPLGASLVFDFGGAAAAAGINSAASGEAFDFNVGSALAGAAVGGAVGTGLNGLQPTRFEPPPPGPPGKSDFSAFEAQDLEKRADQQFQGVTGDLLGGQASDVVETIQENQKPDEGIPIKGSTAGS